MKDPALRVLISIAPPNQERFLAEIVQQRCALYCNKLVLSILNFLEDYGFDGVEIDWQNSAEYWSDFKFLLRTISTALAKKGYTLTVTVRPDDPVDRELVSFVDLILLKSWRDIRDQGRQKFALHSASLGLVARDTNKWIEQAGIEQTSKIVLGLPIFGQGYTLKFGNLTDVGAPVLGPGRDGTYTKQKDGKLAYYEVTCYITIIYLYICLFIIYTYTNIYSCTRVWYKYKIKC